MKKIKFSQEIVWTVEWVQCKYYSTMKKSEINAICSNMDGPRNDHVKGSKSKEDIL